VEAVNEMFRSRHQTSQGAANLRGADKNGKERKNESTAYEEMYDFLSSLGGSCIPQATIPERALPFPKQYVYQRYPCYTLLIPLYLGYSYLMSYLANHAAEEVRSLSLNFLIYKI
jgi:hypothetical protein